ncbi:MAG TPA: hypothetical protein VK590_09795, partial [Saprospiraceae bacterium]|nr:hypothetical protein [Saprospiraceae bacterium]
MKKNLLFIALGLLVFLSSCLKDREVFIPDEGINYKSNILGLVVDESNKPSEGVTVTYNGITKITDKNGIYTFTNVYVSSKHSFLKIRKSGYFEASRAFNTQKSANIRLKNILLAKDFSKSFIASSGGVVEANGYKISFPANAVMVESSSAAYSGQVKVAVKYLDPTLDATSYQMPGNLSGISSKNELSKLITYGMLAVELQSTSGEKLQIKTGSQAEIVANLPATALASAPANIPLWYFDEVLGYWKEEGSAQLVNGTYVGKVSHFSYWNYDGSLPSINVSGKVVDQNGNPVDCEVGFYVPGQYGGHGQTNSDGTFSGPIGKDVVLNLNIYSTLNGCPYTQLYSAQVGPFSTDVVLPDITVNIVGLSTFSCSGTFKDCSGSDIQNGYLKVVENFTPHFAQIVNGQASISFITCSTPITSETSAIDLTNLKSSDPITLTGAGPFALGTVVACAAVPDYITVKCLNLGLDETHFEFDVIDSLGDKQIYVKYIPGQNLEAFGIGW